MKVLITGCSGFVGRHVLRALSVPAVRQHLHLVATGRQAGPDAEAAALADAYVPADLASGLAPVPASVCVHTAGLADDFSRPETLHVANVFATENLLRSLPDCRLFIFISSASVYGRCSAPLKEDDAIATSATSAYGRSKWLAEDVVRRECASRGIHAIILRPRAIYGAGDRVLLPRLRRLMRPPSLWLVGSGDAQMSLTYVGHLRSLIARLVSTPSAWCSGIFNVADPVTYRLGAVLEEAYQVLHGRAPVTRHIPIRAARGYIATARWLRLRSRLSEQALDYVTQDCVLDCTRAHDVLHYAPTGTFFDHSAELTSSSGANVERHSGAHGHESAGVLQ